MIKQIALSLILLGASVLQISAQSFLENNKIPKDLVIKLSLSSSKEYAVMYDCRITSDGRVYCEDHSNLLPSRTSYTALLRLTPGKNKPGKLKEPKLKDTLSKKQIKQIIGEFEKSGFFSMNESYYGDPNLAQNSCSSHADEKGLSISAHGKTKKVSFFLGCSYGDDSPLKSFLSLYDKISEILKGVKKVKPDKTKSI